MLVCPKCGREELGKAKQCRECGTVLPFKTVMDMPTVQVPDGCAQCGRPLPPLAIQCPVCGQPTRLPPREATLAGAEEIPTQIDDAPLEQVQLGESTQTDWDAEAVVTRGDRGTPSQRTETAQIKAVFASRPRATRQKAPEPEIGEFDATVGRAERPSQVHLHPTLPLQVQVKPTTDMSAPAEIPTTVTARNEPPQSGAKPLPKTMDDIPAVSEAMVQGEPGLEGESNLPTLQDLLPKKLDPIVAPPPKPGAEPRIPLNSIPHSLLKGPQKRAKQAKKQPKKAPPSTAEHRLEAASRAVKKSAERSHARLPAIKAGSGDQSANTGSRGIKVALEPPPKRPHKGEPVHDAPTALYPVMAKLQEHADDAQPKSELKQAQADPGVPSKLPGVPSKLPGVPSKLPGVPSKLPGGQSEQGETQQNREQQRAELAADPAERAKQMATARAQQQRAKRLQQQKAAERARQEAAAHDRLRAAQQAQAEQAPEQAVASQELAKQEAEREVKQETERLAKQEAERLEAEQAVKQEGERLARQEAERLEAEQVARQEGERLAKQEAERLAKQEAERLAKAEQEAKQRELLEQQRKAVKVKRAAAEEARRTEREQERRDQSDQSGKVPAPPQSPLETGKPTEPAFEQISDLPLQAPHQQEQVHQAVTQAQPPVPSEQAMGQSPSSIEVLFCASCGQKLQLGSKFCGACGKPVENKPTRSMPARKFQPALQGVQPLPGKARLVLIRGSRHVGAFWNLQGSAVSAGRREGILLFPDDPFMSPMHATFFYSDGKLLVRDENSLNGIFVRMKRPERVQDSDRLSVGRQLFQLPTAQQQKFRIVNPDDGQNTHFLAGPSTADAISLVRLFASGQEEVYRRHQRVVTIGRSGCDINLPEDDFLSQRHARLLRAGDYLVAEDLNSRNGTFLAIREERELNAGDELILGSQLLRVEL